MNLNQRLSRFAELARAEAATVDSVACLEDVPAAVCAYLSARSCSLRIVLAPGGIVRDVPWHLSQSLEVSDGPVAPDGDTVVTGCFAGIAEAGALVVMSGAELPNELVFLSQTHIVILRVEDVVDDFECLWGWLQDDYRDKPMPRTMSFIVGPSRTADLGVPSKLGAHGPARVYILLVGADR